MSIYFSTELLVDALKMLYFLLSDNIPSKCSHNHIYVSHYTENVLLLASISEQGKVWSWCPYIHDKHI